MNTILFTLAQEAAPNSCCGQLLSRSLPYVVLFAALTFGGWIISRSMKVTREARELAEESVRLQKEHQARTEALLERIAAAVEKNSSSN